MRGRMSAGEPSTTRQLAGGALLAPLAAGCGGDPLLLVGEAAGGAYLTYLALPHLPGHGGPGPLGRPERL